MINPFIRLTINKRTMIEKGNAVIKVMLWSAFNPPAFNCKRESTASKIPQNTICHFGDLVEFLVAMLFMTNIPESAEVTKKIIMMAITKNPVRVDKGIYSKN